MLEGAEEAEAAEASLESRRIWGPVCGEQTDAIGAAAAVASVLRRPSSVALNLHVLHVLSEVSSYLEPRSVTAVHLTCKHARGNVDLLVQVNRQIVQQLSTLVLEEQRKCNTSVRLGYHSHDQMVCV